MTMRNHICRAGADHYELYEKRCKAAGIKVNYRSIPKEEKARLNAIKNGIMAGPGCVFLSISLQIFSVLALT